MLSNDQIPPQRLPPEGAYRCTHCNNLVLFKVVRTQPMKKEPKKRYAYLVCPVCGARATQIRLKR